MASLSQRSGTLGTRLAKHLVRRTTYTFNKTFIDQIAAMDANAAVNMICTGYTNQYRPIDTSDSTYFDFLSFAPTASNIQLMSSDARKREQVKVWWIYESLIDQTITHKMSFFLSTLFTVGFASRPPHDMNEHLNLLQYHATQGTLKEFAYRMTLDYVMMKYLDNDDNKKNSANENYARELLELFSIGKGPQIGPGDYTNYTEADVVAAAKVLTGFKLGDRTTDIDPTTGLYQSIANFSQHDTTDKTFSAAFNNHTITGAVDANDQYRELQDMIDMIYNQDETAKYFCRKLYRFFVSDIIDSEIESDIITPLATQLKNSGYDTLDTVKTLLKSQHFYDDDDSSNSDEIIGGKIKSPIEMLTDAYAFFEYSLPDITPSGSITQGQLDWFDKFGKFYGGFNSFVQAAGMVFFDPPSVAGYQAYYQTPDFSRVWFNEGTMVWRYKIWELIVNGRKVTGGGYGGGAIPLDLIGVLENVNIISNPSSPSAIVDDIVDYLYPETVDTSRKQYFEDKLTAGGTINWGNYWSNHSNGVTGSQGTQDVQALFKDLLIAILQTPEFQTF